MEKSQFDRAAEDVGNVVKLEHVNVRIPDQRLGTLYYVAGLGLTRDPYIFVSTNLMWINVGQNQFHLVTGEPDVIRGVTGIVMPDREALLKRLALVRKELEGTRFDFREHEDYVETTCPWGNRHRVHTPDPKQFGRIVLGIPYVQFEVPRAAIDPIAKFYAQVLGAPSRVEEDKNGRFARVMVGVKQDLIFRETDRPTPAYDMHHMQIYISNFSGPYKRLGELGLISMDTLEHEYRFINIIDLNTKEVVWQVEHEVRSIRHPLFNRPLVNRNPTQTNRAYMPGYDSMSWGMTL
jgi:hypothetical protein